MEFEDFAPKLLDAAVRPDRLRGGGRWTAAAARRRAQPSFARRREAALVAASAEQPPDGAPPPPLSRRLRKRREGLLGLAFLLPALLLLAIGLVVPAIRTILLSLMNGDSTECVGLRNYGWIFSAGRDHPGAAQHPRLGGPGAAAGHHGRPALRGDGRPGPVRVGRQVADLPADGDLVRRRRASSGSSSTPTAARATRSACSTRSWSMARRRAAAVAAQTRR